MTSKYFKKNIIEKPTQYSTICFLNTSRNSQSIYEFRGLLCSTWVKNQVFITTFGQKVLPTFMESPILYFVIRDKSCNYLSPWIKHWKYVGIPNLCSRRTFVATTKFPSYTQMRFVFPLKVLTKIWKRFVKSSFLPVEINCGKVWNKISFRNPMSLSSSTCKKDPRGGKLLKTHSNLSVLE